MTQRIDLEETEEEETVDGLLYQVGEREREREREDILNKC